MKKAILSIIIMLLTVVGANAQSNIAQGEVGTCIWYITNEGELVIAPSDGVSGELPVFNTFSYTPWYEYSERILNAKVESSVKTTSCAYIFYGLDKMISVDLNGLNFPDVTDMTSMFEGCRKLENILRFHEEKILWQGEAVAKGWANQPYILSDAGLELIEAGAEEGDVVYFYITPMSPEWKIDIIEGHWGPLYGSYCGVGTDTEDGKYTEIDLDATGGCIRLTLNKVMIDAAMIPQFWGGVFCVSGDYVIINKVTIARNGVHNSTQEVTSMRNMFRNCTSLMSLDINGFDTQNVADMDCMFYGCNNLKTLDISNFNTEHVESLDGMFEGCNSLTNILSSHLSPSPLKVGTFESFDNRANCTLLVPAGTKALYAAADGWNELGKICDGTSDDPVIPADAIASDETGTCIWYITQEGELVIAPADGVSGDLPEEGWGNYPPTPWSTFHERIFEAKVMNGVNAKSCNSMFAGLYSVKTIDISGLNTQNCTDMSNMFAGCKNVTSFDLSTLNTQNVTDMHNMFEFCENLTSLDLSSFNTKNLNSMNQMFHVCTRLKSVNLSSFDTKNVTDMQEVFFECRSLETLNITNFNTQNVTNMNGMFQNCSSLSTLDLNNFDTQNVTDMGGMFMGCTSLTKLEIGNLNPIKVTRMSYMFSQCSNLTSLDLSGFNTESLTDLQNMFDGCEKLTSLDLSGFKTYNVTHFMYMFRNCTNLESLNLTNFDMSSRLWMDGMFTGCDNLTTIISDNATPSPLKVGTFESFDNRTSCTLLVPTGSEALYAAADGWNELGMIDDGTLDELAEGDVFEYEGLWYKVTSAENMTAAVIKNQSTTPYAGDIVIPSKAIYGDYGFTVTALADSCFFSCKEITSVSIAPTVKILGDCSFKLCENLTNVNIPQSVTEIGPRCFSYCYSLNNAVIPSGVSELKKATFYGCENLTSVTIPEGVTALGEMCFHGCVTLPSVAIPSTVTTIDDYCFWSCDTLMKVTNLALVPQEITESTFCRYDTLCVNPESTAAYKAAEYWNLFFIEGDEDEPAYADDVYGTQILVLTSEKPFYNSGNYMAERVTYTRNFTKQTPKGGNAGWETIVLPFDVQRIVSEKGQRLAPFGSFEVENGIAHPFWLAEYTEDGTFQHATKIRANTPYIIAMPNSDDYNQKYCVNGKVMFTAQFVEIHKSENAVSVAGKDYTFTPTYNFVEPAHNVFAINHETYSTTEGLFLPGSIFIEASYTVKPFEAYLNLNDNNLPNAANRRYVRIATDSSIADGIYEIISDIDSVNGKFLQDGKLVIRKNGTKYSATGVQVK